MRIRTYVVRKRVIMQNSVSVSRFHYRRIVREEEDETKSGWKVQLCMLLARSSHIPVWKDCCRLYGVGRDDTFQFIGTLTHVTRPNP